MTDFIEKSLNKIGNQMEAKGAIDGQAVSIEYSYFERSACWTLTLYCNGTRLNRKIYRNYNKGRDDLERLSDRWNLELESKDSTITN